jgi:hypothetical protein
MLMVQGIAVSAWKLMSEFFTIFKSSKQKPESPQSPESYVDSTGYVM